MTFDDLLEAMKDDDHEKVSKFANELMNNCVPGELFVVGTSDVKKLLRYIVDSSRELDRYQDIASDRKFDDF